MKIKSYDELHMDGLLSLENDIFDRTVGVVTGDVGIKIAEDGRMWMCWNGMAFLRFVPSDKYVAYGGKLMGGKESEDGST